MTTKLYRVTCREMQGSHGIAYVLAENTDEAYEKLRTYLFNEDYGTEKDRELEKIELLADTARYPSCGMRLLS